MPFGNRHTQLQLVLIGVDNVMDKSAVLTALEGATVTDAEMAAPELWQTLDDPFWPTGSIGNNLGIGVLEYSVVGNHVGSQMKHHNVMAALEMIRTAKLPAGHSDLVLTHSNLGVVHKALGNHAEAAKWYRKAAEGGDAAAQNNLAILYDSGKGVAHDKARSHSTT